MFSEIWYNADTCEEIPGSVSHHRFRGNRCVGGVTVYVRDAATSYTLNNNCFINDIIENNTVRVVLSSCCSITIVAAYRPLQEKIYLHLLPHKMKFWKLFLEQRLCMWWRI